MAGFPAAASMANDYVVDLPLASNRSQGAQRMGVVGRMSGQSARSLQQVRRVASGGRSRSQVVRGVSAQAGAPPEYLPSWREAVRNDERMVGSGRRTFKVASDEGANMAVC